MSSNHLSGTNSFALGPQSAEERLSARMGEVMTVPLAITKEVLVSEVPERGEEKGVEKGIMSSWAACRGRVSGRMRKSGN